MAYVQGRQYSFVRGPQRLGMGNLILVSAEKLLRLCFPRPHHCLESVTSPSMVHQARCPEVPPVRGHCTQTAVLHQVAAGARDLV